MKKKLILSLLAFMAFCYGQTAEAANIGYSNGTVERSTLFKMGSTKKQGMAIKLDAAKLQELKGSTISAIQTAFGSRNTTGKTAHLFIATSPDATPLVEQDVTISSVVKWVEFALDNPYTITGDEGTLYIGYTAEIDTRYYLLSADYSTDTRGLNYAYKDGEWVDLYGYGYGCVNVRAVVNDAPSFTDVLLKTFSLSGYYQAGQPYNFAAQLYNFGTETITSLDVTLKTAFGDTIQQTLTDLSIEPGAVYDIKFPEYTAQTFGSTSLELAITKVNGSEDGDMTDNQGATPLYFYPENMERSLLLEAFTGQECSNCPTGHSNINSFLKNTSASVCEVSHHIGYYPDSFTMAASDACLLFFGTNGSYFAPAFMMNRATLSGYAQPVMNTGTEFMTAAANYLLTERRPYVSLKLESDFDETTRETKIKLVVYAHENLPEGQHLFNLYLVQDGIKAYQVAGGDNYNHSMVLRGALTDNSWGILLPSDFQAGDSIVWKTSYTLPETIYSDYWADESVWASAYKTYSDDDLNVATDPANTYIVAYVGAYGGSSDPDGHEIYNCTEVKLGESHTQTGMTAGIEAIRGNNDAAAPIIRTEGRHIVVDGCDNYNVYNMSGQRLPANAELNSGIYIVKATAGDKITTKKVMLK